MIDALFVSEADTLVSPSPVISFETVPPERLSSPLFAIVPSIFDAFVLTVPSLITDAVIIPLLSNVVPSSSVSEPCTTFTSSSTVKVPVLTFVSPVPVKSPSRTVVPVILRLALLTTLESSSTVTLLKFVVPSFTTALCRLLNVVSLTFRV